MDSKGRQTLTLLTPSDLLQYLEDENYDPCEHSTDITEKDLAYLARAEARKSKKEENQKFKSQELRRRSNYRHETKQLAKNESQGLKSERGTSQKLQIEQVQSEQRKLQQQSQQPQLQTQQSQHQQAQLQISTQQQAERESPQHPTAQREISQFRQGQQQSQQDQHILGTQLKDNSQYGLWNTEQEVEQQQVKYEEPSRIQLPPRRKKCKNLLRNPFFVDRLHLACNLPPPPKTPPPQFLPPVEEFCRRKRLCKHKKQRETELDKKLKKEKEIKELLKQAFKFKFKKDDKEEEEEGEKVEAEDRKSEDEDVLSESEKDKKKKGSKRKASKDTSRRSTDVMDGEDFDQVGEKKGKKEAGKAGIEDSHDYDGDDDDDYDDHNYDGDNDDDDDDDYNDRDKDKRSGGFRKKKKDRRKIELREIDVEYEEERQRRKKQKQTEKGKHCKKRGRPICRKRMSDISVSLLPPQIPPLQRNLPLTSPKEIPEVERQILLAKGTPEAKKICPPKPCKKKQKVK